MNIRRGLFRLWIVVSVTFIVAIYAALFSSIRAEFRKTSFLDRIQDKFVMMVPIKCESARGIQETDYRKYDDDPTKCWYDLPKFRVHFPEYADLPDKELARQLYKKAGKPLDEGRPFALLAETSGWAFGVPLVLLLFGSALVWAFSGFKIASRQDSN